MPLCKVVHKRGFKVALVARYGAIPEYLTTAIFPACGMGIYVSMLVT